MKIRSSEELYIILNQDGTVYYNKNHESKIYKSINGMNRYGSKFTNKKLAVYRLVEIKDMSDVMNSYQLEKLLARHTDLQKKANELEGKIIHELELRGLDSKEDILSCLSITEPDVWENNILEYLKENNYTGGKEL